MAVQYGLIEEDDRSSSQVRVLRIEVSLDALADLYGGVMTCNPKQHRQYKGFTERGSKPRILYFGWRVSQQYQRSSL